MTVTATAARSEAAGHADKCQADATLLPHRHASIPMRSDEGTGRPGPRDPRRRMHHREEPMHMTLPAKILLLLAAIAPGAAYPAAVPPGRAPAPRAITLAEAIAMAVQNDVSVVRAEGGERNANASVRT